MLRKWLSVSAFLLLAPLHALAQGDPHAPGDGHAHAPGDGHAHAPGDGHAHAPDDGHAHAPGDGHAHAPGDPHGAGDGHGHGAPGQVRLQNGSRLDPALPAGTIVVTLADREGKPLAGVPVTLGVVEQTVAKGESRRREVLLSQADGTVRWDGQKTDSSTAYRISVNQDGASFALTPFRLETHAGQSARLHVLPVTRSLQDQGAVILSRVAVFIEIKDDRVQIEQEMIVANFGSAAWVPDNITFDMPREMTAFTFQQGMSDQGVDKIPNEDRVKLRGTFAPGQHRLAFRWQLPYGGERDLSFAVGSSPNMAQAAVLAFPAPGMRLEVGGMGDGKLREDLLPGQRMLAVEWDSVASGGPVQELRVALRNIPEAGLPIWLTRLGVALAALIALAAGVSLWIERSREKGATDSKGIEGERAHILEELAAIERAHTEGEIGPKTYERARRELIDQLAMSLAQAKSLAQGKTA